MQLLKALGYEIVGAKNGGFFVMGDNEHGDRVEIAFLTTHEMATTHSVGEFVKLVINNAIALADFKASEEKE